MAPDSKFTVVTSASADYFPFLQGLLASLSATIGKVPITVLDLGMTQRNIEELRDRGVTVVPTDWDIQIAGRTVRSRHGKKIPLPSSFRAFTAQPFLPKYAPGYDTILWIDADCWVQDPTAIDLYLASASDGKLAISLEVDRCYGAPYWRLKSHVPDFIRTYGLRTGFKLAKTMTANVGVFALKSDAPHWRLWQNAARHAFASFPHQRSQQMAMNHVVYIDKAPTLFLPAYCNWQSWEAIAMLDESTGLLVEPQPPYHPIGVMHNADEDKNQVYVVNTRQGNTLSGTMRYEQWNPPNVQRVALKSLNG